MRVFLTGATGFIGEAIIEELLGAGHEILGLARNEQKARLLERSGVSVQLGDLDDTDSLVAGARASNGVIHTAFGHDFSKYLEAGEADRRAIKAMGQSLAGTGKPLVITSATTIVMPGQLALEDQAARADSPSGVRALSEHALAETSSRGVRGVALRLPPSVHAKGDHGFVPALIEVARRTGVSAYIGDGANCWPAVHRRDAARLYRLALEKAPAGALHGVAEPGIPMRDIAAAIGEGLGIPVRSLRMDQAKAHFDWLAMFVAIDNPTSSAFTQRTVGWQPREKGLLEDLRDSGYFNER